MVKSSYSLALAIIILGLAVAWRLSTQYVQALPKNQPVKLQAILKSEPRIYDRSQILAIGDSKFYVDLYPRYRVGDKLLIEGEVDEQGRSYNPKIELVGKEVSLATTFAALRAKIAQNVSGFLPGREATLLSGTVLGVDEIDREFRDLLVKTGTIHVVVVSGQNLMIVAGVFLSLAGYFGRRQSLAAAVLAVFFYALLTGFEPPVVRASIMVILGAISIYLGRESLPIWNLVMAALLIVFIWPQAIFEISFQLTFAATLGIMTLGQKLSQILNFKFKILNLFGQNAAIATSAYLFTAPIILFYFGRISPIAPIANILVAEAVFPIMILGFLTALFSLVFWPIAQVLAFLAYVPAFYFVKVVEILAWLPIDQITLGKNNLFLVLTFYILVISLILVWTQKAKSP